MAHPASEEMTLGEVLGAFFTFSDVGGEK